MPHIVTDKCQRCRFTDCVTACPVACFHGDEQMLYIDNAQCVDCCACVHIVGRRGPAQAKFTNKELRELGELSNCATEVAAVDLQLQAPCLAELEDKSNFTAAKNVEILQGWVAHRATATDKRIVFHFLASPLGLAGNGRLESITLEKNRLSGPPFGQSSHGTGYCVELRCGLLFRSIGYRGRPLPGVPFDESKGVFPNDAGRIGDKPGLYAAGWIKRGPSGIIGTNRADAVATVQTLMADLAILEPGPEPGTEGLCAALARSGARVVDYADWLRIDAEEQRRGAVKDKPREKITRVSDMLAVLGS